MHLAFAVFGLLVGEQPNIGSDACVVEDVVRQLDDGIHQVILNQIATDVALAAARIARKQRRPVVNGSHAAALGLELQRFHLVDFFEHKQQLSVGSAWCAVKHLFFAGEIGQRQFKTVVEQRLLVVNLLLVGLPRLAVWRIGDHIAKRLVGKGVIGNGVAQVHPTRVDALDNQVGLANGVCLRVDFGSRQLDGRTPDADIHKVFTAFGQHSTRATCRIIQRNNLGKVVLHGFKNEVRQQRNGIAGREVFARFLVVLLVEATQQLLKHGAHANVGHGGQHDAIGVFHLLVRQVDARVGDFLDDGQESVVVGQFARLVVILEVLQNIAHILAEAVKVFDEIVVKDVVVVRSL